MKIFDAQATRDALPFSTLIPALRDMFVAGCEVPARQVHEIAASAGKETLAPGHPKGERMTSLVMPAWQNGRHYGIKVVNVAPENAARALPGLHSSYLLFDATTGVPQALIDGSVITARRTAAASALAATFVARGDAQRLLLVGAGAVARLLPEAYRTVLPIKQVTVWARSAPKAAVLAAELRTAGFDATATGDLAAAVAAADIVSCATLATEALVQGRWLRAGSHLDLIGSFTPAMREADDDCFAGARLYLDTGEALTKSGDLLGPISRGVFGTAQVCGTLADLCRGSAAGRQSAQERTVFKSVGTALEDLAAAMLVYAL